MNCRKVQNLISAYVDSELPGVEMLAVRQHLSDCAECNSEYETLLRVKRAFGGLNPKMPAQGLATRIYFQLDQLPQTPKEPLLASVIRKHMTLFPGKLRFAATTMSIFAVLLTIRSGQIYTGADLLPALPKTELASSLGEAKPVQLFPAASNLTDAHMATPPSPAPAEPWMLNGQSGGSMVLASYSVPR